ncbi:uncharacterized protein LOC108091361 isoform X2 [Drosophila ficusphila]|uniref:uncharacterized protein LOC108091361 isoform X2 n=1 Tax=Drosophila ficusphila TaxID=30025 RepID=UPI0007E71880|nr:uncharacterized protein LOC108091361 isoform X2 [Drosophila ficusphila]
MGPKSRLTCGCFRWTHGHLSEAGAEFPEGFRSLIAWQSLCKIFKRCSDFSTLLANYAAHPLRCTPPEGSAAFAGLESLAKQLEKQNNRTGNKNKSKNKHKDRPLLAESERAVKLNRNQAVDSNHTLEDGQCGAMQASLWLPDPVARISESSTVIHHSPRRVLAISLVRLSNSSFASRGGK